MNTDKHLHDFKVDIPGMNLYAVMRGESLDTKAQVLIEFVNHYINYDVTGQIINEDIFSQSPYQELRVTAKEGYRRADLNLFLTRGDENEYEMYLLNRILPVLTGKPSLEDYKGGTRASYTVWAAEPTATKVEMVKQFLAKHKDRQVYVQHTKLGDIVTNNYLPILPSDLMDFYEVNAIGDGQGRQSLRIKLIREPNVNRGEMEVLEPLMQPLREAMPHGPWSALDKT